MVLVERNQRFVTFIRIYGCRLPDKKTAVWHVPFRYQNSIVMLKYIRMPVTVKALCGATIGFLIGLYMANTYFGGAINYVVYLCALLGAGIGVWLLRR